MENILIVSSSKKGTNFFTEVLSQNSYGDIITAKNGGEARRLLIERDFDLCIINAPLVDEFGEEFARNIVSTGIGQAILIWSALKLANATYNKMCLLKKENNELLQKIEDIRMIDRAKCILIQYLNMTESEAHRYIEKQAMDMRSTKRVIAEGILRTYEN